MDVGLGFRESAELRLEFGIHNLLNLHLTQNPTNLHLVHLTRNNQRVYLGLQRHYLLFDFGGEVGSKTRKPILQLFARNAVSFLDTFLHRSRLLSWFFEGFGADGDESIVEEVGEITVVRRILQFGTGDILGLVYCILICLLIPIGIARLTLQLIS